MTVLECKVDDVLFKVWDSRMPYNVKRYPGPYTQFYRENGEPAGYVVRRGENGMIVLTDDWEVVETRGKARIELAHLGLPMQHAFQDSDGQLWPMLFMLRPCIVVLWNGYPMCAQPGNLLIQFGENPPQYDLYGQMHSTDDPFIPVPPDKVW